MSVVSPATVIEQLQWRYSVKRFDASKKIPTDVWNALEQAMILAPSSYGLQPWKFVVVTNPELRKQLRPAAWNQSQVVDASHLVVFCSRVNISAIDVDRHLDRIVEVRKSTPESLAGYRTMMLGLVERPGFPADEWCTTQTYIALGQFLTAAAMMGVDVCPMKGFEPDKFDTLLGLKAQGYAPRVLATAGYRAADDHYAKVPKVRFDGMDLFNRH